MCERLRGEVGGQESDEDGDAQAKYGERLRKRASNCESIPHGNALEAVLHSPDAMPDGD